MGPRERIGASDSISPPPARKQLELSRWAYKDLGVHRLTRVLSFCRTDRGEGLLSHRASYPFGDREQIIKIQDAVESIMKGPEMTNDSGFLAAIEGFRPAFEMWKKAYSDHLSDKMKSNAVYLNGLRIFLKASIALSGALIRYSSDPLLNELREIFSLSKLPTLQNYLRALRSSRINLMGYSFTDKSYTLKTVEDGQEPDYTKHEEVASYMFNHFKEAGLKPVLDALAELDYCYSLAMAAKKYDLVRPEIVEDGRVQIKGGKHPVLLSWQIDPKSNENYWEDKTKKTVAVPNNTDITIDKNVLAITGPNTCGKTTYLTQLGLTVVMAQMGSFVPADGQERPVISIFDNIHTIFGAEDELGRASSFQAEVEALKKVLPDLTPRSLLLCDEIFRTTEPESASPLTYGTLSYLAPRVGVMAIATHYISGLEELARKLPGLQLLQVIGKTVDGKFVPTYEIKPGVTKFDRYGIHVANSLGLPAEITGFGTETGGKKEEDPT